MTATLTAAEIADRIQNPGRCACSAYGSWGARHRVSGTSDDRPVVWAGCPYCRGRAVGHPVPAAALARYEREHGACD